jgi:allophanate hydrolase subunit 1
MTELHSISASQMQDIELAAVSQRLVELFRTRQLLANAVGVREGCSLDDPLVVPRTESPRPAIPRRGFALGAEFAAITGPG